MPYLTQLKFDPAHYISVSFSLVWFSYLHLAICFLWKVSDTEQEPIFSPRLTLTANKDVPSTGLEVVY